MGKKHSYKVMVGNMRHRYRCGNNVKMYFRGIGFEDVNQIGRLSSRSSGRLL
jgi:hypothetical protein